MAIDVVVVFKQFARVLTYIHLIADSCRVATSRTICVNVQVTAEQYSLVRGRLSQQQLQFVRSADRSELRPRCKCRTSYSYCAWELCSWPCTATIECSASEYRTSGHPSVGPWSGMRIILSIKRPRKYWCKSRSCWQNLGIAFKCSWASTRSWCWPIRRTTKCVLLPNMF